MLPSSGARHASCQRAERYGMIRRERASAADL